MIGHELYRMIRDGAPPCWTPLMRLVAETIADDARDPGQGPSGDGGWPWSAIPVTGCYRKGKWIDGITERTGMSKRAISRTLTDLARVGYEMREVVGRGADGRVVFTTTGHSMRFRVPRLVPATHPSARQIRRSVGLLSARRIRRSDSWERSPSTATARREPLARFGTTARQIWRPSLPRSPHRLIVL